jgi:hypothetical protein
MEFSFEEWITANIKRRHGKETASFFTGFPLLVASVDREADHPATDESILPQSAPFC